MRNGVSVVRSKRIARQSFLATCVLPVLVLGCGGASPYREEALSIEGAPESVYFIVDTSESMNDQVAIVNGGRDPKIEIAARAVSGLADDLNAVSQVGLRIYPDPLGSECNAGNLRIDLGRASGRIVKSQLAGIRGESMTPTAEALVAAARDVRAFGAPVTVVLVSDGYSSCDEPCSTVRRLSASTDWTIITVGFDLGNDGSEELRCIADAAGGKYVNAADGAELEELFGDPDRLFSVTG